MKMRTFRALFYSLILWNCWPANGGTNSFFRDDFDGNQIDTAQWVVSTPFSDSRAFQTNGVLRVQNRGGVLTQWEFPAPKEITGRVKINNGYDILRVVTRTTQQYAGANELA